MMDVRDVEADLDLDPPTPLVPLRRRILSNHNHAHPYILPNLVTAVTANDDGIVTP